MRNKCVQETQHIPYCCNPLTVAEGNKLRLVLDLRHVNKYVKQQKFKYENLATVAEMFEQGFYFGTFDLKSGYHHVPIAKQDQQYLGFSWTFSDGSVKYFEFLVLPFGLSSACYAFTKLMKPLLKKWRGAGIRSALYLDDGIFWGKSFEYVKTVSNQIVKDLCSAGLTINVKKSQLNPTQKGQWLGIVIDTVKMDFFVSETKIKKLASMISNALNQSFTTAKFIARIAGNIISMGIAIGPLTRLFTRQMYKFIESRLTWHSIKEIDKWTKEELIFWHKNLQNANGFRIKTNKLTSKIVYSDASGFAYGGFILQRLSNVIAHGYFTEHEILTSSTNRELLTVKYVMESLGYLLQHESVLWYSDNFNTARIIEVGSTKPHLQKIALEIFELCLKNDITLHSSWIPR